MNQNNSIEFIGQELAKYFWNSSRKRVNFIRFPMESGPTETTPWIIDRKTIEHTQIDIYTL